MDSRLIKYIVLTYFCFVPTVFAGTDLLSNALTQSNVFLKEAGNVQREYSKVLRKITTMKINPDALLGEKGKMIKEKAEKAIDKANSLKEKAEKVKKVAEMAQAEGAALMEKYNKLNEQAAALKADAEATLAKGREIRDMYTTGRDKLKETLDEAKDLKDKLKGENDNKETEDIENDNEFLDGEATDAYFEETEKTEIPSTEDNGFRKVVNSEAIKDIPNLISAKPNFKEKVVVSAKSLPVTEEKVIKQLQYNQAEAIGFASNLANQVNTQTPMDANEAKLNVENINQSRVSVSDVMSAVHNPDKITSLPAMKDDIRSVYNIEEQLERTSNYAPVGMLKNNFDKNKISNEEDKFDSKLSIRAQFKTVNEEKAND